MDRRAGRSLPVPVQVAGILGGVAIVLGFFALLAYCLERDLDLDPVLQAINGPFGLVAAIGIVVNTFQNGRVDRRVGRVEALAGREGASVLREQNEQLLDGLGRLERVLGPAMSELARANQQRGARRADTGVQPAVRDEPEPDADPEVSVHWTPEPVLDENGGLQLYATALPPSPDALPLPQDTLQRAYAQYSAMQRDYDEERRP